MRDVEALWAEIEPWLTALDARRRKAVQRAVFATIGGIGTGVLAALLLAAAGLPGPIAIFAGAAAALGLAGWGGAHLRAVRRDAKQGLNEKIAQGFGLSYALNPPSPARFSAARDHGLLPRSDRQSFEDHFAGEAHGAQFELYEAHLKQKRRSKKRTYYVTVFRGVIVRIAFPRTIEGVTLITRDKGVFNAFERWAKSAGSKALERIGLVDPTFESLFEVYGTDQVMARYLLTPTFMERILELETALKGKNIRAVFDEGLADGFGRGELLIAAETGNLFEPGSMYSSLARKSRVEALHRDIALIERIIDTVLAPPENASPAP